MRTNHFSRLLCLVLAMIILLGMLPGLAMAAGPETLPPEETVPPEETLPPEETVPPEETLPPEETVPREENGELPALALPGNDDDTAPENGGFEIKSFTALLVSGASLNGDGNHVWTANDEIEHAFK